MTRLFALILFGVLLAAPARAAQCGGDFGTFLSAMGRDATAAGVSRNVIDQAFAGEIGQTQFLPSSYIKYGVDYDGNGHVDLRHSVPDVLASTANLLKTNGWKAGAPFGEGTENFQVMREWNRSEVYRKTMALFAEKLRGP